MKNYYSLLLLQLSSLTVENLFIWRRVGGGGVGGWGFGGQFIALLQCGWTNPPPPPPTPPPPTPPPILPPLPAAPPPSPSSLQTLVFSSRRFWLTQPLVTPFQSSMPVNRMRMRPWLIKMIDSRNIAGLEWIDKVSAYSSSYCSSSCCCCSRFYQCRLQNYKFPQ